MRNAFASLAAIAAFAAAAAAQEAAPDKLLWGDTHLHTRLSVDAFFLGNPSVDADTAYRFAKGEPAIHPYHRARVQLETPLDFLAVTDHGELMGVPYRLIELEDKRLTRTRFGARLKQLYDSGRRVEAFGLLLLATNVADLAEDERPPKIGALELIAWRIGAAFRVMDNVAMAQRWLASDPTLLDEVNQPAVIAESWRANLDAADRHNEPGKFTALVGWEYTSTPDGANLHRNVITDLSGEAAKAFLPYGSTESIDPADLWAWLDETSAATGGNFVSMPHNSNVSKGRMFGELDFRNNPWTAETAGLRARWETVGEITQIKGSSETRAALSPEDDFADFEIFGSLLDSRPGADTTPTVTKADYIRPALMRGLEIEAKTGVNPFKLGVIGSTDAHTGFSSAEENNFMGKTALDSIPENKETGVSRVKGWEMSAAGLAAVWARENTREEIIAAFRRREVYASSGPRIALRFFAGYDFTPRDAEAADIAAAGYARGEPMGGEIGPDAAGRAPRILVSARRDPKGANLDRIQIVKGWLGPDGAARETVYDVSWSAGRTPDADGRLPPVGDTVDRRTARHDDSIGAERLAAVWTDPDFDPEAPAFYYARVLQIPTARNSLYDSIALGAAHPEGYPAVIQERAWSSPVWYAP